MVLQRPALLALADGTLFRGVSIGLPGQTVGEVVFNTAMTGYQEVLTDPSYDGQIITFTCPHIGNTGVNPDDEESARIFPRGLVIRTLSPLASNWRSSESLESYLHRHGCVGIAEVDTRRLTRRLRETGAQNGCIVAGDDIDAQAAVAAARAHPGLAGADLAAAVGTTEPCDWSQGAWRPVPVAAPAARLRVTVYDYGVKRNILRLLVDHGCRVTVVPARTPVATVLAQRPDGILLGNGPGDPDVCDYGIGTAREVLEAGVPLFGICFGHQLLALASGARTVKMKFGHHGTNHPVLDLESGAVYITSQNHGFAVDEHSLPANVVPTHRSLFDGSLQGIRITDRPAFGFQGHPEDSPGPHDLRGLFNRFVQTMDEVKSTK